LDGFKGRDSTLRPEQLIEDVQTLPVATSTAEVSGIPHSVSAASLSSESDLALLLGTNDSQAGSTPLVFGSFPPVYAEPSATAAEVPSIVADSAPATSSSKASSKLKPDSHEFYPQAYIAAAAAATALAARTISSVARSASPASDAAAEPAQQQAPNAASAAAASLEASTAVVNQPSQEIPAAALEDASIAQPVHSSAEVPPQQQQAPEAPVEPQHSQYWAVQQQQLLMPEQQWHQQQQQWQQWQQQQQQAQQQMVPMPVLVPVYMQPYPYTHYVQQHPQVHYVMMAPDAAAAAAAAQAQQVQQQQMQVCPPSPGGYSLPADTCSLMSATTPAATPTAWHHNPHYGSSRPGSSASSVVSAYSSVSRRQRQSQYGDQAAREAGTVTVSAMSCVKDAAGALAKVITRHNNALLVSLVKPGDAVAQATHVAAKSLAVARFYINAHMAAAGAAGIDAAAALTGIDSTPDAPAAAADAADSAAAAVDDEVVFMPYNRSSGSRQAMDTADVPLGFMVAKASAKDLPVLLPPPVGIPACMQDKLAGGQQRGAVVAASSSASTGSSSSSATLLKAGANTDVNKLSNAVIHNILGR
jgi:hypothetical protein